MNAFNIIVTVTIPFLVVAYISWDLYSHKFTVKKSPEMSQDKNIDRINMIGQKNRGVRTPEGEISASTQNDVVTYGKLF